jgi:hypothetical protein
MNWERRPGVSREFIALVEEILGEEPAGTDPTL